MRTAFFMLYLFIFWICLVSIPPRSPTAVSSVPHPPKTLHLHSAVIQHLVLPCHSYCNYLSVSAEKMWRRDLDTHITKFHAHCFSHETWGKPIVNLAKDCCCKISCHINLTVSSAYFYCRSEQFYSSECLIFFQLFKCKYHYRWHHSSVYAADFFSWLMLLLFPLQVNIYKSSCQLCWKS